MTVLEFKCIKCGAAFKKSFPIENEWLNDARCIECDSKHIEALPAVQSWKVS